MAAVGEFTPMGVQVFRGRIEDGGTVDDRRVDEAFLGFGVAARRHQSGFGLLRAHRSGAGGRVHASLSKDLLPHVTNGRQTAMWADIVNNRTRKSPVNPLTRPASRSVMRASYSVAAR